VLHATGHDLTCPTVHQTGVTPPDDVEEGWLNQQINRARAAGEFVCALVRLNTRSVNMVLSTPGCSAGGGGGRRPNDHEQRIFDLWANRGLNESDFSPGNLIAFLHQLARLL
jgi:hypothetical protein